MSAIRVFPTELKNAALICAALTEMKVSHDVAGKDIRITHGALNAQSIYGGVTIRPNRTTGLYSASADGDYRTAIDGWLGHLKQEYRAQQQLEVARRKGYQYLGRTVTESGNIQLRLGVR